MARFKDRVISRSFSGPQEFSAWVKRFSREISKKEILLISGDLGAGKTFFVTELVHALGGPNAVSPSFAIHNHYEGPGVGIDHIDLYRLKNLEDLESTGFWDLFSQAEGLIVIEWANKLKLEDFLATWPVWEINIDFIGGDRKNPGRQISCTHWV